VPSWKTVTHEAIDESVLFSFSDRAIQDALHLFREQRDDA
jgi:gentisate 1,2-dioxygenase